MTKTAEETGYPTLKLKGAGKNKITKVKTYTAAGALIAEYTKPSDTTTMQCCRGGKVILYHASTRQFTYYPLPGTIIGICAACHFTVPNNASIGWDGAISEMGINTSDAGQGSEGLRNNSSTGWINDVPAFYKGE